MIFPRIRHRSNQYASHGPNPPQAPGRKQNTQHRSYPNSQIHASRAWQQFRLFSRSCRLKVFTQMLRWKQQDERTKTVVYRRFWTSLINNDVHVEPPSIAITHLILNSRGLVLDSVRTTSILTALQFAAKLLEMLVQASLTAVLLSCLRDALVGRGRSQRGVRSTSGEVYISMTKKAILGRPAASRIGTASNLATDSFRRSSGRYLSVFE